MPRSGTLGHNGPRRRFYPPELRKELVPCPKRNRRLIQIRLPSGTRKNQSACPVDYLAPEQKQKELEERIKHRRNFPRAANRRPGRTKSYAAPPFKIEWIGGIASGEKFTARWGDTAPVGGGSPLWFPVLTAISFPVP